jgi:hypothetical protein
MQLYHAVASKAVYWVVVEGEDRQTVGEEGISPIASLLSCRYV